MLKFKKTLNPILSPSPDFILDNLVDHNNIVVLDQNNQLIQNP